MSQCVVPLWHGRRVSNNNEPDPCSVLRWAPYRSSDLPAIPPQYLRILYSTENLLQPPSTVLSGAALQQLNEKDEATRRLSSELIQMMAQQHPSASDSPQGVSGQSMVLTTSTVGPTHYFLPRIQRTIAHTRALFLSNGTPAPSDHTPSSPEVTKAAAARFAMCIGSGAILSSEVMLEIMEEVEHNIEQKKLEEERRTAHRNSQHPIWLSLLNSAISQQLAAPDTKLNKQGVILVADLQSWCKKLQITRTGVQIEVANRLLRHFGLHGEAVCYKGGADGQGEGEVEGAEQTENDDHEAI